MLCEFCYGISDEEEFPIREKRKCPQSMITIGSLRRAHVMVQRKPSLCDVCWVQEALKSGLIVCVKVSGEKESV